MTHFEEKAGRTMLSSFYWIIENEIAGMAMPTASMAYLYLEDADGAAAEEMRREIQELQTHGIGAVVTLTENPLYWEAFKEAGMTYLHIPVPDMTAPTPTQIRTFMQFARENIAQGRPVVVHCMGGMGRTGTMLACYLVAKGIPPRDAIKRVRKQKPGAIETHWQEEAVFEYAAALSESPRDEI